MSNEFKDIDKDKHQTYKIVVPILYVIVIILFVFLVIGIKKQKDTVKQSINDNNAQSINNDINTDEGITVDEDLEIDDTILDEEDELDLTNDGIDQIDEALNLLG